MPAPQKVPTTESRDMLIYNPRQKLGVDLTPRQVQLLNGKAVDFTKGPK
jgi:hypothetical protein